MPSKVELQQLMGVLKTADQAVAGNLPCDASDDEVLAWAVRDAKKRFPNYPPAFVEEAIAEPKVSMPDSVKQTIRQDIARRQVALTLWEQMERVFGAPPAELVTPGSRGAQGVSAVGTFKEQVKIEQDWLAHRSKANAPEAAPTKPSEEAFTASITELARSLFGLNTEVVVVDASSEGVDALISAFLVLHNEAHGSGAWLLEREKLWALAQAQGNPAVADGETTYTLIGGDMRIDMRSHNTNEGECIHYKVFEWEAD